MPVLALVLMGNSCATTSAPVSQQTQYILPPASLSVPCDQRRIPLTTTGSIVDDRNRAIGQLAECAAKVRKSGEWRTEASASAAAR